MWWSHGGKTLYYSSIDTVVVEWMDLIAEWECREMKRNHNEKVHENVEK